MHFAYFRSLCYSHRHCIKKIPFLFINSFYIMFVFITFRWKSFFTSEFLVSNILSHFMKNSQLTISSLLLYRQEYPISSKHSHWDFSVIRVTLPRWPSGFSKLHFLSDFSPLRKLEKGHLRKRVKQLLSKLLYLICRDFCKAESNRLSYSFLVLIPYKI